MNSIKDMRPSFDQLTSVANSKEFLETFCVKAIKLLDEFKKDYSRAMKEKNISDLHSITHKISSTMKWINLDEFVALTKSYKDLPLTDKEGVAKLLDEVMHQSNKIEESIRAKLAEL